MKQVKRNLLKKLKRKQKHTLKTEVKQEANNNFQQYLNQITKKAKIKYLNISNRDLAGEVNLSEFTVLTSLNSYNNKFKSLEFLNSLPNLKAINIKNLNI